MWDNDDMEQYHEDDTYHFRFRLIILSKANDTAREIIGTATMEVDLEG